MVVCTPPVRGIKAVPADIGMAGLAPNIFLTATIMFGAIKTTLSPIIDMKASLGQNPVKGGIHNGPEVLIEVKNIANTSIAAVVGKTDRLAKIFMIHWLKADFPGTASPRSRIGPKSKLKINWM